MKHRQGQFVMKSKYKWTLRMLNVTFRSCNAAARRANEQSEEDALMEEDLREEEITYESLKRP